MLLGWHRRGRRHDARIGHGQLAPPDLPIAISPHHPPQPCRAINRPNCPSSAHIDDRIHNGRGDDQLAMIISDPQDETPLIGQCLFRAGTGCHWAPIIFCRPRGALPTLAVFPSQNAHGNILSRQRWGGPVRFRGLAPMVAVASPRRLLADGSVSTANGGQVFGAPQVLS